MSQGIKFLYQFSVGEYNLLDPGSNIISVTSTAAGDHNKKNLTTTPLRETWRSASVAAVQEIVIEANDTTDPIDVFAILNHNISENAVITLQANTVNNFSSPPFTRTLTWNEKHIVLLEELPQAYNFYKLKVLDTTNPCGYIEIGRIVAGTAFTIENNEDITDDFSIATDDLAYKMKSEGFFRASNERVQVDRLQVKFDKLNTTSGEDDNYQGLLAMTKYVGETLPFLTILDPNQPYFSVIWGQIDNLPSKGYMVNRYVNMQFTIQEVY